MVIDIMARRGQLEYGSLDHDEDYAMLEDDPHLVSLQVLTGTHTRQNVRKAYQSVINMLDRNLQVIGESEISDIVGLPKPPEKGSSDQAVPCLATLLFFNGSHEDSQDTRHRKTHDRSSDSFSKPDLLLNHAWNKSQDLEGDFSKALDLNDNDVTGWTLEEKASKGSHANEPFQRFDAILKESRENEKGNGDISIERDIGFRKGIFDFEVAERTLDVRKQLETWPWEFHHKAVTKKGITQYHWNTQDFYAYQPERDVTRLYGDVIDTTKITKRKSTVHCANGDYHATKGEESDSASTSSKYSDMDCQKRPIATSDYPLVGVREVHYGKQHLRYTLFVSDSNWMYQVEFYRLLLRHCPCTLRNDFCLFTVYRGESTDIQFAVKKLGPNQNPVPLCSTVLQFKVHKVGSIVPLLPNSCKLINKTKWYTTDHDGNIIVLNICPREDGVTSDTASSYFEREITPLGGSVRSRSEARLSSEDENLSLERLDSFVEPELPERMPLLQSSLYSYLPQTSRFGSRYTSSHSAGSSSSTSPDRRSSRYSGYRERMFSPAQFNMNGNFTLPNMRHASTVGSSSSRISESSDDPENTNFYRKAKGRRDNRRRSDFYGKSAPRSRSKSSSRTPKKKNNLQRTKSREDEVVVFV